MEYALIVLITSVIGGGVAGGLITAWHLHVKILSLNRRVNLLEEVKISDQGREKAKKRWDADKVLNDIKSGAQEHLAAQGSEQAPFWWK